MPYPQSVKILKDDAWKTLQRDDKVGPVSLAVAETFSTIEPYQLVAARGDAEHNVAVLALAVARYQLKNGQYPDKLDDLVPEFLPFVPRDPFDANLKKPAGLKGLAKKLIDKIKSSLELEDEDSYEVQPMKYKHTDQGVIIYSIGPDMVDDGGNQRMTTERAISFSSCPIVIQRRSGNRKIPRRVYRHHPNLHSSEAGSPGSRVGVIVIVIGIIESGVIDK